MIGGALKIAVLVGLAELEAKHVNSAICFAAIFARLRFLLLFEQFHFRLVPSEVPLMMSCFHVVTKFFDAKKLACIKLNSNHTLNT